MTWVGIDGYYLKPSWQFAPLFGPTIASRARADRRSDPHRRDRRRCLTPASQRRSPTCSPVFALYGLLGFVYFDATNFRGLDFSLSGPAAIAAFRQGAGTFARPVS